MLLLALRNVWVILVKQGEYKNLPILMFYLFSLLAITLRLIEIIWYWTPHAFVNNITFVQQFAKFCVGIVQDWITFELAILMRCT